MSAEALGATTLPTDGKVLSDSDKLEEQEWFTLRGLSPYCGICTPSLHLCYTSDTKDLLPESCALGRRITYLR